MGTMEAILVEGGIRVKDMATGQGETLETMSGATVTSDTWGISRQDAPRHTL